MRTCLSCLRSVPEEARSCPACGMAMIASATPTRRQPAEAPAEQAASPALNADVRVNRLLSPDISSEGRFIAGAMLAGRYRLVSLLGAGGMGEVYLGYDTQLDRAVALKILPAAVAANQQRLGRFIQEAHAAAVLDHPSIAYIYEIGESDGTHFIAMEYIDGDMLRRRLQAAPMTVHEAVDVAIQVAAALSAAHEASIVHRDIKPENIMLRRRDQIVKVLDFGLAKIIDNRAATTDTEAATLVRVVAQTRFSDC